MNNDVVLFKLDTARTALMEAKTIQETKKILDVAAAAEIYAKRQKLGEEAVLYATSIKVEALRQLGNMLKDAPKNTGAAGRTVEGETRGSPKLPRVGEPPTLAEMGLDKKTSKLAQDIASLSDKKIEEVKAGVVSLSRAISNHHISDDTYEWFTPEEVIKSARFVMGSIDLDPATSAKAQESIKAGRFFTREDNGLVQEWSGNVWLNPPYSMPEIELFCSMAVEQYELGNTDQSMVLTNNSTDTNWFHLLAKYPFCLTKGRLRFWNVNGEFLEARQGQAIFYLGKNIDIFVAEFKKYGKIFGEL